MEYSIRNWCKHPNQNLIYNKANSGIIAAHENTVNHMLWVQTSLWIGDIHLTGYLQKVCSVNRVCRIWLGALKQTELQEKNTDLGDFLLLLAWGPLSVFRKLMLI